MNLKDEIRKGESHALEFKRTPNEDAAKYLKTVVAFANGKGGRILFGVANDRTVIGIPDGEIFQVMDAITDSVANGCSPQIPMDVSIERIDDKSVIALEVFAGTHCPYYLKSEGEKNGVYLRIGATTRLADDAAWHDLAMEGTGRSFDREPCPKAKIDDAHVKSLCSKMYRIARRNCGNDTERRTVKRVTERQLESWGVISRVRGKLIGSKTYAMLVGDKAFTLRIRCGVFKGDTKAVFVDRREFAGPLCELIDKAHEYVLSKINVGMRIVGAQRHDVYELPPASIRELIVNAFAHRNYFDHEAPIFIAIYDTRVEITSPGGLPRGLTVEKAMSGCSKIRNRAVASVLAYMKYVEGWGSGFLRVSSAFSDYGLAPLEVIDDVVDVRVSVRRPQANAVSKNGSRLSSRKGATVNETVGATVNETAGATVSETVGATVNEAVNASRDAIAASILEAIQSNPGIRRPGLLSLLPHIKRGTLTRRLSGLSDFVEFRGSPKTGGYYCIVNYTKRGEGLH